MKIFSLILALILSVFIIIIAFGNIQAQFSLVSIFFWQISTVQPTLFILAVAGLGGLAGIFYGFFIKELLSPQDEESDGDF